MENREYRQERETTFMNSKMIIFYLLTWYLIYNRICVPSKSCTRYPLFKELLLFKSVYYACSGDVFVLEELWFFKHVEGLWLLNEPRFHLPLANTHLDLVLFQLYVKTVSLKEAPDEKYRWATYWLWSQRKNTKWTFKSFHIEDILLARSMSFKQSSRQ